MTNDSTERKWLDEEMERAQVMSLPVDMAVEIKLLESVTQNRPKLKGLELGAGAAGWPKVLHSSGITNVQWHLVENFEWTGNDYEDNTWPTNRQELFENINKFDDTVDVGGVYDMNVADLVAQDVLVQKGHVFDLMRIDCDIRLEEFEYFVRECLTTDALVFIDDSKTNCGLFRVMLGAMMISKGLLFPVWFGEKEALYCVNYERSRELGKLIKKRVTEELPRLHANMESKIIFEKRWFYATTTMFEIFVPNKDEKDED